MGNNEYYADENFIIYAQDYSRTRFHHLREFMILWTWMNIAHLITKKLYIDGLFLCMNNDSTENKFILQSVIPFIILSHSKNMNNNMYYLFMTINLLFF